MKQPPAKTLPEVGSEVALLTYANGGIEMQIIIVRPRHSNFILSASEWLGSDGCRHSIDSMFPCEPKGLPTDCPISMAPIARPFIYARKANLSKARACLIRKSRKAFAKAADMSDMIAARCRALAGLTPATN